MSKPFALCLALALTACGTTYQTPAPDTRQVQAAARPQTLPPARSQSRALSDFRRAAPRVGVQARAFCREERPRAAARDCDFQIKLIDDPKAPPNAYQTIGKDGRPLIVLTISLLAQTGSADEIAFVLSHEAGHHIAGHLGKQQTQQMLGALVLGGLVAASGAGSSQAIEDAINIGAALGGRAYSQTYELEADTLGAFIAARAGYDPERGSLLFARPALSGGGGLLSTHPASPQRLATVQRATAEIRRQQAAGLTPRPAHVERGWF